MKITAYHNLAFFKIVFAVDHKSEGREIYKNCHTTLPSRTHVGLGVLKMLLGRSGRKELGMDKLKEDWNLP